ncbi:MAG: response regulator [Alphaproteobacteria bacterium]
MIDSIRHHSSFLMTEIDRMLFERIGDIRVAATDPVFCADTISSEQIAERLATYRNTFKTYISISYFSRDGIRLADTSGLGIGKRQEPGSVLAKQWEHAMTADVTIAVGKSTSLNENVIFFAKQVRCASEDAPRGMVVTRMALSQLEGVFAAIGRPEIMVSADIDLFDRTGLLLYSNHNRGGILKPAKGLWTHFSPAESHDSNRTSHIEETTAEKIIIHTFEQGHLDFKGSGWSVGVSISRDVALAPATALRNRIVVISATGIGLAILLALFLARHVTRPIHALVETANDVSSGRLSVRAMTIRRKMPSRVGRSIDEFTLLSTSIDRMIVDLDSAMVSRDYVDNIIGCMNDVLLVLSEKFVVESVNRPDLLGYAESDMVGWSFETFFNDSVAPFGIAQMEELVRVGTISSHETSLIASDGRTVPVLVSGSVMRDEGGNITGVVLVAKEIGDFKRAQQQIQDKEAQLLAAKMANRAKSDFLATMSHEIRTPMNAVIGLTDLALKTDLAPRTRDYLVKIKIASRSLMGIINDILDFSKIEEGKLELAPVDFQLDELFDHLGDLFRSKAAEQEVELIMGIAGDCPCALVGDALRLEQVLMNLIGNAIKFTRGGEVDVSVAVAEQTPDRVVLAFAVQDTGIGLTEEQIGRLFEPFVQADGSITRRFGGTGLGLSISKHLVVLMEGRIWVESSPGEGSVFRFTATFARRPDAEKSAPIPPDEIQGLKVLVVDGHAFSRETMHFLLSAFTFAPALASSSAEALAAVRSAIAEGLPYRLVVLDYRLPDMDGIETAQVIVEAVAHEFPETAAPKIILLTPFGVEERIEDLARRSGVQAFVGKPVNRSHLFDTVMEVFGQDVVKRYQPHRDDIDYAEITDWVGGSRVLLVEDMPINQQVARELLESVGVVVDIASNGVEAVRMVDGDGDGDGYDAVLMDVQMPVMDGYEATRTIRRIPRYERLPIIAMTAHSMTGDRELCLAAGMNDHIAKPIDTEHLFAVLTTHIKHRHHGPVDRLPSRTLDQAHEAVILPRDLPGIDRDSALRRLMGNQALLANLLVEFHQSYGGAADEVRRAFEQGDPTRAGRLAHQIKGVAGNIGASGLQAAAADLDLAVKQGRSADWPALTEAFVAVLRRILTVTGGVHPVGGETAAAEPDPGAVDLSLLKPGLAELAGQLAQFKLDSTTTFNTLKPILRQAGFPDEAAEMEERIARFDFHGAQAPLRKIIDALDIKMQA